MKPKSASEMLRQYSPRKMLGAGLSAGSRFSAFRDISPANSIRSAASSIRERSASSKRKLDHNSGSTSWADIAGNSYNAFISPCAEPLIWADNLNVKITKVKSLCDKTFEAISSDEISPALVAILGDITTAIRQQCDIQAEITASLGAKLAAAPTRSSTENPGNSYTTLGAITKRARVDNQSSYQPSYLRQPQQSAKVTSYTRQPQGPSEDPLVSNFKAKVKEAEKSTLLFNLDLGKTPIMNQNTISAKVTTALTSMAASVEGKQSSIPSDDAVAAIDDVLSVVKGMAFFGKSTKTYKNTRDKLSGAFCTIPVKYSFKDKDTRIRAEAILREKCQVNCSTPYPTILREALRQVASHVKGMYPKDSVRTSVDLKNMGIKVSRRPPCDPGSTTLKSWKDYDKVIPLPPEVFDTSARKIPDGFRVGSLPAVDETPMETHSSAGERQSRKDSLKSPPKSASPPRSGN